MTESHVAARSILSSNQLLLVSLVSTVLNNQLKMVVYLLISLLRRHFSDARLLDCSSLLQMPEESAMPHLCAFRYSSKDPSRTFVLILSN